MTTAIGKWGGAGLRIPQPFMKQLGLSIGDEVKFPRHGEKISNN